MIAGFATLTEPRSDAEHRRFVSTTGCPELREFLIGQENRLLRQAIGLQQHPRDLRWHLDFDCLPLVLVAPSGYGKSHLLEAITATWSSENDSERVVSTSAADFAHAYAQATKVGDLPRFQQRFRAADLLLLDDLDTIRDRASSQYQLASILDHRQHFRRPTILAARQPMHELRLVSRLASRLAAGLIVPLQLPSRETRLELLERICRHRNVQLDDEAAAHLADQAQLAVPQMLGVINHLTTTQSQVDKHQIESFLTSNEPVQIDVKKIIRETARHFGLPTANLTGSSRRKMDVLARGVAIYLIRQWTELSFHQIGHSFNGRDHTTVMHSYKKVKNLSDSDATARSAIQELSRKLMPLPMPQDHRSLEGGAS